VLRQFILGSSSAIVGSHYKVDIGLQLNEPFILSVDFANNTVTLIFHFFSSSIQRLFWFISSLFTDILKFLRIKFVFWNLLLFSIRHQHLLFQSFQFTSTQSTFFFSDILIFLFLTLNLNCPIAFLIVCAVKHF
jgi:hypothetical protein